MYTPYFSTDSHLMHILANLLSVGPLQKIEAI